MLAHVLKLGIQFADPRQTLVVFLLNAGTLDVDLLLGGVGAVVFLEKLLHVDCGDLQLPILGGGGSNKANGQDQGGKTTNYSHEYLGISLRFRGNRERKSPPRQRSVPHLPSTSPPGNLEPMRIVADPANSPARGQQARILVPTMGALHQGHLELIRHARTLAGPNGEVAVSIFVNPIQFDRPGDLAAYPRPYEDDLEKCRAEDVDLVFTPEVDSIFFPDRSTSVLESSLSKTLCGATRPGHFDGVCTIVLKLFNLLQPSAAVFGEKDYQQLSIIRRMVRDLNVPVEIVAHPTIRERDGLAMSSRNTRLSPEQRADAPRIRQALVSASEMNTVQSIIDTARTTIESPLNRIDYLELVDAGTLQAVTDLTRPSLLATAVFYGEVRLIDNHAVPPL